MLRKPSEERYADWREVDAALAAALKQADGTWEVPLCEAWGPHTATTVRPPDMWLEGEELLALYERLASYERRPVRGKPPPLDERTTLASAEEPPGPEALGPPPACEQAPAVAEPPAPTQEARSADEAREEAPAARSRTVLWRVGAALVLGLCVWLALRPSPRVHSPAISPVGTPRVALPPEFHPITLEPSGREVASPWKRPEGDGGAAPEVATTPVPVAHATPPKDKRVKTHLRPSPPSKEQQRPKATSGSASTVGGLVLSCTIATGCTATPAPQVLPQRPLPSPAECPPRAVETMKALGIPIGKARAALFPGGSFETLESRYVLVREGPGATMIINETGTKLPDQTVLSGELFFGAERIYGRFTEARTPAGETYPICMVLGYESRIGVGSQYVKPGEAPGTAYVLWSLDVTPVERFE